MKATPDCRRRAQVFATLAIGEIGMVGKIAARDAPAAVACAL